MAPSPEHDNEPKAPDKSDGKKTATTVLKLGADSLEDGPASGDLQESSVSTLDDGQLKALLDEAINYKCPKDREGKSRIFKVLLQEAEEDERNARAASASGSQLARYYNTSAARRNRRDRREPSISENMKHGGSLQNLAQPELFDASYISHLGQGALVRRRRKTGQVSVSARQREGGSLPSNVNAPGGVHFYDRHFFEEARTTGHKRSKQDRKSSNASSEGECRDWASLASGGKTMAEYMVDHEMDSEETKSLLEHDALANSYESTNGGSGGVHIMQTPSLSICENREGEVMRLQTDCEQFMPQIRHRGGMVTSPDAVVTFSQLAIGSGVGTAGSNPPPLQLETDYSSVSSCMIEGGVTAVTSDGLDVVPSTMVTTAVTANIRSTPFRLTNPLSTHHLHQQQQQLPPASRTIVTDKKSLDENGNSVNPLVQDVKTKQKKKGSRVDRKVTVLTSEQVEGHRADIIEDIDLLVKYVECGQAGGRMSATRRTGGSGNKQQQGQNRRTGRLKTGHVKSSTSSTVKKSNSLEEISTSKLEDLTEGPALSAGDRKSWGTEDGEQYQYCKKRQQQHWMIQPPQPQELESMDSWSHVVTKKKKSKKRRSNESSSGSCGPTSTSVHHELQATKDGSAAGRSSTHCAIATSGSAQLSRRKSSCSVPGSDKSNDSSDVDSVHSLPVGAKLAGGMGASYADMAREATSESTSATRRSSPPSMFHSVEHFPELSSGGQNGRSTASVSAPLADTNINLMSVSTTPVMAVDKRPAVIIPVSTKDPIEVSGLTFGFELNEQLLAGGGGGANANVNTNVDKCAGISDKCISVSDLFTARFVPPVTIPGCGYNHDKIVTYVGLAWDDVVHQPSGKVQYYSGQ